jgi:tryptophan-rich sensory protein
MNTILAYIISFSAVILTSFIGQLFTSKNVKSPWYLCIKTNITPPGYVFPIVWTILYILIALAFATALITGETMIIVLFTINLVLNISWCYAFFYIKNPNLALIQILFVLLTACAIIIITHNKMIRFLLIPYIAWLSFATILNVLSIGKSC